MFFFTRFLTLLTLAVIIVTASCTAPISDDKHGGHLKVAIPQDPDGLDPHRTVAAATFELIINIYDTLIDVDPDGNLVPNLATSWHSVDETTWELTIADDITFHDGRPCTATDIKASFERMLDEQTAHPRAADYDIIDRISAPDDHTLIFHLSEYRASFLSNLAMGWAAIVDVTAGDLRNSPQGTGPFKLQHWTPDQELTLIKHDNYHRDMPYLDQVTFRVFPDPAVQIMNLRTGDIDIIGRLAGELAEQVSQISGLSITSAPQNMVQIMPMNNDVYPFSDVRIRQALSHAIDKQEIITGAGWGYGSPIGSHMPPIVPHYVDLNDIHPYDPDQASQLLEKAGLAHGFSAVMSLPAPYDLHCRAGEIIASQLRQIGVNLQLDTVEWGVWLDDIYFGREYELTVIAHTGRLDPDPFLNRYATDSRENYMNFHSQRYNDLIAQAATMADEDSRAGIYRELQLILAEQVPAVYLQSPHGLTALRDNIHGWQFYPVNVLDLRSVYVTD